MVTNSATASCYPYSIIVARTIDEIARNIDDDDVESLTPKLERLGLAPAQPITTEVTSEDIPSMDEIPDMDVEDEMIEEEDPVSMEDGGDGQYCSNDFSRVDYGYDV